MANKFLDSNGVSVLWSNMLGRLETVSTKVNAAYTHAVTNKGVAKSSGLYKITTNSEGHITAATAVSKSDITALGIPSTNTTYSAATTSAAGLMSASDKSKLDGIAANANSYSLPAATSSALGGVKIGYSASGKNYAVQLDTNGKAYVNVPWENTTYTSLKNPNALTISLNGTSQGAYDGSAAKSINITASSVGAAASSHTHSYVPLSGGTMTGALNWTGALVNTITGNAEADIAFKCVNSSGSSVQFGVGGEKVNHGVYSLTQSRWIIYGDASDVYVPAWSAGSATQPVYFSGGKPVAATSYANATVGYASYLNTCNTNEIRINNATGLTDDGGDIWIGYKWKDSASWTKGKGWIFGNFCGGKGNITANKFIGSLQGNADTATSISGTVAIANGGTGATSAAGARSNLGICGAISYGDTLPGSGSTGDIFFVC